MSELPSGTVTLLFTDVEGSTKLLHALGRRYGDVLAEHDRILREAIAHHDGHEIDTQGDAFYVAFRRAGDAVAAAVEAQQALKAADFGDGVELRVRMGMHTGEPAAGGERYVGLGVHRAARICSAGHGGQVLLSSATHELLEDDLPDGLGCEDLGAHQLKDFDRPVRLFQLSGDGLLDGFPPLKAPQVKPPRRVTRGRLVAGLAATAVAVAAVAALVLTGGGEAEGVTLRAQGVGLIDPESGRLEGQVRLGASPSHLVSGAGAVWISAPDTRSVIRVDPATRSVRQTIAVGSAPSGLALADGAVWVANTLDGTVSRIDATTNEVVAKLRVGDVPTGMAAAGGAVWVANSGEQTLSRIDPASGRVESVGVGVHPTELLATRDSLWVSSERSNVVLRLDPRTGEEIQRATVGSGPSGMASSAGSIWVANSLDGTVSRLDPETGRLVAAIPVGNGPRSLAPAPGGVWVNEEHGGTIDRIDAAENRVTRRLGVGHRPSGLVAYDGLLWTGVGESRAAHRGGMLRVVTGDEPDFLDPALAYSTSTVPIMAIINDGLVTFRKIGGPPGWQVVPDLAIALPAPTDGGRSYRFVLRRGIRYSTGRPVRATDVRPSFERLFRVKDSPGAGFFSNIVGADGCGRRRCDLSKGIVTAGQAVTFHLTAPDPEFLQKLSTTFGSVLPADTPVEAVTVPATGPYVVSDYEKKRRLILKRNPHFREWSQAAQPDGYPDVIEERFHIGPQESVDAVVAGRADAYGGARDRLPGNRVDEALTRYRSRTYITPIAATHALFLNTRLPPFDDVRVRRAVAMVVDRRAVVRDAGGRATAVATCQILPPNYPGRVDFCPFDSEILASARRLVRQAGAQGTRVEIWASDPLAPPLRSIPVVLRRLGLRASLRVMPSGRYWTTINRPDHRVQAGPYGWYSDYLAASTFLWSLFNCDGVGASHYCDRRLDARMQRALARQVTDPQGADEEWTRIDKAVVRAAPWVPLYNVIGVEMVSERVGNYQYNVQYGSLLSQMWVR